MNKFITVIRKQAWLSPTPILESTNRKKAITIADNTYCNSLLDSIAVVEVDSKYNFLEVLYKRERKCKHLNIQLTPTETGTHPLCTECGLKMEDEGKGKHDLAVSGAGLGL